MFKFLGLGRATTTHSEDHPPKPETGSPGSQRLQHEKQREMIRLALSAVLRRHGIASQSLDCEVIPMTRAGVPDVMLTQLVLRQWHDGLVHYAPALQAELFKEINLFDKSASQSNFLFVWKFAPDCGYPNGKLPESGYWVNPALGVAEHDALGPPLVATAKPAITTQTFDLPRSELDDDDNDQGFAATQIDGDR